MTGERRLKIVICSEVFAPRKDGISRFLVEIVKRLKQHFDICVCAPQFGELLDKEKEVIYELFPLSGTRIADLQLASIQSKRLVPHIAAADIVWIQTYGPVGRRALKLARKFKKKIVISSHVVEWELYVQGIWLPPLVRQFAAWVIKKLAVRYYNSANLVFAASFDLKQVLRKAGVKSKIEVVHLGVDSNLFSPSQNKLRFKRLLGYQPRSIVIGYCGRFGREKDLGTLVAAFKEIRRANPNVRLLLIGDGPEKEDLQGKGITITGFVSDVASYLKACDIFVLPSLTETTSLATLEALSTGLAVVSTRVGYVKEYITHGLNGLFFEAGDVEDLRRKLELLLSHPEKREMLGLNGRQTVKSHLTWDNTSHSVEKHLKSIV